MNKQTVTLEKGGGDLASASTWAEMIIEHSLSLSRAFPSWMKMVMVCVCIVPKSLA